MSTQNRHTLGYIFIASFMLSIVLILHLAGSRATDMIDDAIDDTIDAYFLSFHDEERCENLTRHLNMTLSSTTDSSQIVAVLQESDIQVMPRDHAGEIRGYTRRSVRVGRFTTRRCQVSIRLDDRGQLSSVAVTPIYEYHGP